MLLSSVTKLSKYVGKQIDGPSKEAIQNRQKLLSWQAAVSAKIEDYCRREFLSQSRTEYFDTGMRQRSYFPKAIPIASITSVKADSLGRFDGTSDWTLEAEDYHIGTDSLWVDLNFPVAEARRGLQLVYTGGLATNAVRSAFTVGTISGTPTVGWWVRNDASTAAGIVRAWSSPTLTVENVYGVFAVGDVLSFATAEEGLYAAGSGGIISGVASTITAISSQSLAEAYPDLERAVEVEVRYMATHQMDFENVSTLNDQTSRRQSTVYQTPFELQPETRSLLSGYRRPWM